MIYLAVSIVILYQSEVEAHFYKGKLPMHFYHLIPALVSKNFYLR